MALWLKCGLRELAFEHDIVPREAMRTLVGLDDLEEITRQDIARLAHEARAQQDAMLTRARAEADAVGDKARLDATAAARLGYAQGRRDGLRQWHAEASAQRAESGARYRVHRDLLADLVVQATAALLQGPALAGYLENALRALDTLAQKDLTLTVRVHPDDQFVAQQAIDRLRPQWRDGTVVKVLVSDTLAPGSCVCESPSAYVDASLSLQLATLRQAARGALQSLKLPDDGPTDMREPTDGDAAATLQALARPEGQAPPGLLQESDEARSPIAGYYHLPSAPYSGADLPGAGADDDDRFEELFDEEYSLDGTLQDDTRQRW